MQKRLQLSNREKIMLYFLAVLVLLNLLTILYVNNLNRVSAGFKSILEDRLVPSVDISKMQEGFYKKRLNLESYIYNPDTAHLSWKKSLTVDQVIDSVLIKYSKTKITKEEAADLKKLRFAIEKYRTIENSIELLSQKGKRKEAQELFRTEGLSLFQQLNKELHKLSNLQIEEGSILYHDAKNKLLIINFISYISIAIAIFLAINMFKVLGIKFR